MSICMYIIYNLCMCTYIDECRALSGGPAVHVNMSIGAFDPDWLTFSIFKKLYT